MIPFPRCKMNNKRNQYAQTEWIALAQFLEKMASKSRAERYWVERSEGRASAALT